MSYYFLTKDFFLGTRLASAIYDVCTTNRSTKFNQVKKKIMQNTIKQNNRITSNVENQKSVVGGDTA